MAESSVTVRVIREVADSELLHKPLRRFLNRSMLALHEDVAQPGRVPIDTGNLRGSLQPGSGVTGVDPANPPKWAKVGTRVKYGTYLERGARYHYLRGPAEGKPTKGWLSDTVGNVEKRITGPLLKDFADDIKAAWRG